MRQRVWARRRPPSGMSCPDANMIVAFVDGRLPDRERTALAQHVESCEPCMGVLAGAARNAASSAGLAPGVRRAPVTPGTTVGRYLILSLVGQGGMADVYAAYD